ncbi:protogloblin ApPgb [Pseudoflavitalea sp. X16]|uniref:protoglobin domain-containing protein n=1 Tax=Paraflavitalea devenefica TaxID=2716334 RepID=UPI00141F96C8|nr:protoglobin domain-containing protein [Paraflavitalea devenefica]NII24984.1 protogloblin ApPgb [Paraflavitalea devenefica]
MDTTASEIKGYDYGKTAVSPVSLQELELLKATVLFTAADEENLRKAGDVLTEQAEAVIDIWYELVGSHPHLLFYFSKNNMANLEYLTAVRKRFVQWVKDICHRPFDQTWLNYQYEIALRHHKIKKNKTDEIEAAPFVHYRYIITFIYPITATIKPLLAKKGHTPEEVEAMHQAWFKAVVLTATLMTYPYVRAGEF